MAVSTIKAKGALTTIAAVLRTGANPSEHLRIKFRNSGGSTRVVSIYEDGSASTDLSTTITLQTGYFAIVRVGLGSGNTIEAKQDAGTDVLWFLDEDALS